MLNYIIEGAGPRVTLLHPIGLDHASWRAVIDVLKEHYTIIAMDAPGHGASPRLADGAGLEDYAAAIHATLAANALLPTALVGLSFGGMLTQHLAVNYPGDFTRLVIAGCTVDFPEAVRPALEERGRNALSGGMHTIVEATMERWFTPAFLPAAAVEPVRARLLADEPRDWAAGWAAISRHDCAAGLSAIACPTLCLAGALDLAAPPEALQRMASIIPGARLLVIEGAPHMMQIETPAAMAAGIHEFLADV